MEKDGLIPTTTTTTGGGGLSWQALVGEMKNNNNNNNNNYSSCNSGGGVDQLATAPFLNLNWDQSSEQQAGNFESALSSLVSSPTAASSSAAAAAAANSDSVVIRELIGRLGSICNNPNSPPNSQYQSSTNTSCYTTPLNSPPKLNLTMTMTMMQQHQQQQLMPFAADPGFVERAARFSCFGAGQRSYNNPQLVGVGELSSSQSLQKSNAGVQMGVNVMESSDHGGGQLDNDDDAMMMSMMMMTMMRPEDSAGSGRERMAASGGGEGNVRKRKAKAKPKAKDTAAAPPPKMADEENSNANKRCKSAPENGVETGKVEQDGESAHKQPKDKEKDNNAKPAEPPKLDYIHVRARRGQATDSHSLAERVRREKISERMKFLQDLVPGCNKVTGKAVMLDEIINYVQSLQRQVEFLSMKLATVNPRLDFNADSLLPKDTQQPASGLVSSSHLSFPLEQATSAAFSYSKQPQGQGQVPPHPSLQCFLTAGGMDTQCSVNPLDNGLRRSLSMHLPPLDGSFMDAGSQLGAFWEDDLQSVVQMGFGQQNQLETISSSHNLQGTLPTNHMKIEL